MLHTNDKRGLIFTGEIQCWRRAYFPRARNEDDDEHDFARSGRWTLSASIQYMILLLLARSLPFFDAHPLTPGHPIYIIKFNAIYTPSLRATTVARRGYEEAFAIGDKYMTLDDDGGAAGDATFIRAERRKMALR